MKRQETVSAFQLSMLFIAYGSGSAIINIPAPLTGAARNGAWVSIVIACAMGMFVLAAVMYMHRRYPGLDFIQYGEKTLGKWLMFVLVIPYLCAIFFMLALIMIDIGSFFNSTMLKETNSDVIRVLFFLLAALTARGGIEVMVRMFLLLIISALVFVAIVLCMAAPNYNPEFLLPVMPDGIKPIIHGTYMAFGFPFAEASLFAMLLPYVREKERQSLHKPLFTALLINGFLLLISIVCTIMAEGPMAGELKYSLYQLARLVYIQEIFERIESVIGFSLIIVSYMKATIVLYILSKALGRWAKVQDSQLLVLPIAFVCFLLSVTMYENETDFANDVNVVWPLLDNVAFNAPLLLIVAVTLVRGSIRRIKQ